MEKLINSYRKGKAVNNKGILLLIEHYRKLELLLSCHGELYHLTWKDVFNEYHRLLDIAQARNLNIPDNS